MPTVVTFDASTTWTAPTGVTSIQVECYGGGGGGGNGSSLNGGAGGGGGAYAARVAVPVTPGNIYTITVGTGGSPQVNGNDTTFVGDSSVTVTAKGGGAGVTTSIGVGGSAASSIGDAGLVFAGGNGGDNTTSHGATIPGAGGGASGNDLAAGANGQDQSGGNPGLGGAGANGGGSGGHGQGGSLGGAQAGFVPGGGSGGAAGFATANSGAHGRIIITYTLAGTGIVFRSRTATSSLLRRMKAHTQSLRPKTWSTTPAI